MCMAVAVVVVVVVVAIVAGIIAGRSLLLPCDRRCPFETSILTAP